MVSALIKGPPAVTRVALQKNSPDDATVPLEATIELSKVQIQNDNYNDISLHNSGLHDEFIGAPEFQKYQHLLNSPHTRARVEGIRQLLASGDESSLKLAASIGLADFESHVRAATCQLLKKSNLPEIEDALILSLKDSNPKVRWSAVNALSGTLNQNALDSLINQGLADPVKEVRDAAFKSLCTSQNTHRVLQEVDLASLRGKSIPS